MPITLSTSKTLLGAALALTALSSQAVTLVGITSQNQVALIDTSNIAAATTTAITGLAAGERFVGIDLRPTDNTIYGVTTSNNIYTLNQVTGAASFVIGLNTAIINPSLGYGIDFNPVNDYGGTLASLRLISSAGNNYGINVATGAVGNTASNIGSGFSGAGYTNSSTTEQPTSTGLYYVNSSTDTLSFAPGAFNTPTITTVGSLGVDVLRGNGFEVLPNGQAFAGFTVDDGLLTTGIYSINLATGTATSLGTFNGTLNGLTVAAVPEPETYALMLAGLGLVGFMAKRRKSA